MIHKTIASGLVAGIALASVWAAMWTLAFPWDGYMPYMVPVFLLGGFVGAALAAKTMLR